MFNILTSYAFDISTCSNFDILIFRHFDMLTHLHFYMLFYSFLLTLGPVNLVIWTYWPVEGLIYWHRLTFWHVGMLTLCHFNSLVCWFSNILTYSLLKSLYFDMLTCYVYVYVQCFAGALRFSENCETHKIGRLFFEHSNIFNNRRTKRKLEKFQLIPWNQIFLSPCRKES